MVATLRAKRIDCFVGIKAITMIMIFWLHSPLRNPPVDLASIGCGLLFVVSGFLVGYNRYYVDTPSTWADSISSIIKKIVVFWPLHALLTLLEMWRYNRVVSLESIVNLLLHLAFLQAWSTNEDVYFGFNGASWFLSALLFCYFLAPLFVEIVKNAKSIELMFGVVFLFRLSMEYIFIYYPNQFLPYNIHVSPMVRCVDFFMGMLLVPLYFNAKNNHIDDINKNWIYSVSEILVSSTVIFILIKYSECYKSIMILLFCILIFTFSFDRGILSKLLGSKLFLLFSKIQFEFFLFHQPMIRTFLYSESGTKMNNVMISILAFISTVVTACVYKFFLEDILAGAMKRILAKVVFEPAKRE